MTFFHRRRLVNALLVASVLLNAGLVAYIARPAGLRRLFLKADPAGLPQGRLDFQKEAEERYRKLPNTPAEVIFAGDSLVAAGPWAEFYTEIHNRGIGGDGVSGLLGRLDEILDGKPRKLILLVGTNDLAAAVPDSEYIRQYRALLERARKESPETAITVLAIFPVNLTTPQRPIYDNAKVAEVNRKLKDLVAEFPGVRFLDLTKILSDEGGNLRRDYCTDALHLNLDGYLAIREALRGPVLEGASKP